MSLTIRAPGIPVDLLRTDDRASLSWQVSVLGDMVATLDTLTTAGQHHVIGKVVAVVRDQVQRAAPLVSRREREILAGLVEEMEQRVGSRVARSRGVHAARRTADRAAGARSIGPGAVVALRPPWNRDSWTWRSATPISSARSPS